MANLNKLCAKLATKILGKENTIIECMNGPYAGKKFFVQKGLSDFLFIKMPSNLSREPLSIRSLRCRMAKDQLS